MFPNLRQNIQRSRQDFYREYTSCVRLCLNKVLRKKEIRLGTNLVQGPSRTITLVVTGGSWGDILINGLWFKP